MNANDFLNSLYESSWKNNVKYEALAKVDKIITYLEEHREEMADVLVSSVQDMEMLKLEQKEEFTYTSFGKWLDYYAKQYVTESLEKIK